MDIEKIGKFIKQLRNEKNISQNQLSEEIHVTRQAISNWENGKAIPDSDILLSLSKYFDISINEILSGERNISKDNLQDIALQLIDDNNTKKKRIKRILLSSTIIIVSILLVFLGYYFINNYNSIKVYSVNGRSGDFKTYNGIFVTTRNKLYMRLGKIKLRGKKDVSKMNKVQLFYLNKENKKVVILEDNEADILLDEDFGYKEYFYTNNLNEILNRMYIEITYNESEKEIIKLKYKEKFENNFLFKNSEKLEVVKDEITPEMILKKDKQMEEIISHEKEKVDEMIKTRNLLDSKENVEDQPEPEKVEKTIYVENNIEKVENNIEKIENPEVKENNEIEEPKENIDNPLRNISNEENTNEEINDNESKPEEPKEPEEQKTISLDDLINKIKEKGTFEYGEYKVELPIENKKYIVSFNNQNIMIEILYETFIEEIQLFTSFRGYSLQKYENFEEIEIKNGNIDSNKEIIETMKIIYNNI